MPVQADPLDLMHDLFNQIIAQHHLPADSSAHIAECQFHRFPHPDDPRHILRSRAFSTLLAAAVDKGRHRNPVSYIQKSHAFRSVKFVGARTQQIDVILLHRDRDLGIRLHRIRMKQNLMVSCKPSDLHDRFDRSDLIVSKHDRDQDRILPDGML